MLDAVWLIVCCLSWAELISPSPLVCSHWWRWEVQFSHWIDSNNEELTYRSRQRRRRRSREESQPSVVHAEGMDQFNCSLLCCRCWQWTTTTAAATRSRACNSSTIEGTFSCQLWWTSERERERKKENSSLSLSRSSKRTKRENGWWWWRKNDEHINKSQLKHQEICHDQWPNDIPHQLCSSSITHVSRWAASDLCHPASPGTTEVLALTSDKWCVADDWLEEGHSDSISVKSPAGSSLVYQLLATFSLAFAPKAQRHYVTAVLR